MRILTVEWDVQPLTLFSSNHFDNFKAVSMWCGLSSLNIPSVVKKSVPFVSCYVRQKSGIELGSEMELSTYVIQPVLGISSGAFEISRIYFELVT